MVLVYIALGSNIEPRISYLEEAIMKMGKEITITKTSSIYQTAPVGYQEQDPFLNMVVEGKTNLQALALLAFLQGIEGDLHRRREVRWGPRTIDLDILLYGKESFSSPKLQIPHPRMGERAFVLIPLKEIQEGPIIKGFTAKEILSSFELKEGDVVKWGQLFHRKGDM